MTTSRYYLRSRGKVSGPFSTSELQELRARGRLGSAYEVSEDRISWHDVTSLEDVFSSQDHRTHVHGVSSSFLSDSNPPQCEEPSSQFYFVDSQGKKGGPISKKELAVYLETGNLLPSSMVWQEGMADWNPLERVLSQSHGKTKKAGTTRSEDSEPREHEITLVRYSWWLFSTYSKRAKIKVSSEDAVLHERHLSTFATFLDSWFWLSSIPVCDKHILPDETLLLDEVDDRADLG